ncbi:MAG: MlaD family protein [Phycisphaerae bacterium]|nr:MlaD family protein [Phycisphaerae bacterium]
MNETRQNLIVGAFALVGLIVFGALIMMFGDVLTFVTTRSYYVTVHFPKIAKAVRDGTSVTLNGKRIGQVVKVDFRTPDQPSEGLAVVVAVENRYSLPLEGTRATIETSIMGFGRPSLQLMVDSASPDGRMHPKDGSAFITGYEIPMLDQIIKPETQQTLEVATKQIGDLAARLTPVVDDLHGLLQARSVEEVDSDATQRLTANLSTAVQRLDQALKAFNVVLADPTNQENLVASIANLRKITDNANLAMEDLKVFAKDARTLGGEVRQTNANLNTTLDSFRTSIDSSSRKFADTTDAAASLLRELNRTALLMNEGQGTAGLFLNDNRLYESMVLTFERLTKTLDEFRDVLVLAKKGELRYRLW